VYIVTSFHQLLGIDCNNLCAPAHRDIRKNKSDTHLLLHRAQGVIVNNENSFDISFEAHSSIYFQYANAAAAILPATAPRGRNTSKYSSFRRSNNP
jgi:hypothetical protein